MIFALIPAAGKSLRMGRPKLSLPIGNKTVLELVIATLWEAGIDHVLVVIGPAAAELSDLANAAGANILQLSEETSDMRATVVHGLRWLEENFRPTPDDDWLLTPADHPTLNDAVVRDLIAARRGFSERSIIVPTFKGQRGHPTLISWRHKTNIEEWSVGKGLNVYLRDHALETLELPVDSESVLLDLDTPADYERLKNLDSRTE